MILFETIMSSADMKEHTIETQIYDIKGGKPPSVTPSTMREVREYLQQCITLTHESHCQFNIEALLEVACINRVRRSDPTETQNEREREWERLFETSICMEGCTRPMEHYASIQDIMFALVTQLMYEAKASVEAEESSEELKSEMFKLQDLVQNLCRGYMITNLQECRSWCDILALNPWMS